MDREWKIMADFSRNWTDPTYWQNAGVEDASRCLVACGIDGQLDKDGMSPLHMASLWSDVEIVQAFLDAGVSVRSLDKLGRSPLIYAANRGDVGIVRALLKAGANANVQSDKRDITALHIAAKKGDHEIVQALLEAGADVDLCQKIKGMTPLHFASAWGNVGSVKALLDAGADARAKDAFGKTPLAYASDSVRALLVPEPDFQSRKLKAKGEPRNIMLYWNDAPPPEICDVVEKWRNACPDWNVALFNERTACLFLRARFGGEIARLFLRCAIPAMKSDFFRVFWAIAEGGIYSDVSFVPKRKPLFFDLEKNITVVTHNMPSTILNGFFHSKQDSNELKLVAHEIIRSVSLESISHVGLATGPAAWGRALGQKETSTMAIISWNDLRKFVDITEYSRELRSTETHWSSLQKCNSIYRASADIRSGRRLALPLHIARRAGSRLLSVLANWRGGVGGGGVRICTSTEV